MSPTVSRVPLGGIRCGRRASRRRRSPHCRRPALAAASLPARAAPPGPLFRSHPVPSSGRPTRSPPPPGRPLCLAAEWVAIDDRDLLHEQGGAQLQGRFVRTNMASGLTPALADRAIKILSRPAPPSSPVPPAGMPSAGGRPALGAVRVRWDTSHCGAGQARPRGHRPYLDHGCPRQARNRSAWRPRWRRCLPTRLPTRPKSSNSRAASCGRAWRRPARARASARTSARVSGLPTPFSAALRNCLRSQPAAAHRKQPNARSKRRSKRRSNKRRSKRRSKRLSKRRSAKPVGRPSVMATCRGVPTRPPTAPDRPPTDPRAGLSFSRRLDQRVARLWRPHHQAELRGATLLRDAARGRAGAASQPATLTRPPGPLRARLHRIRLRHPALSVSPGCGAARTVLSVSAGHVDMS